MYDIKTNQTLHRTNKILFELNKNLSNHPIIVNIVNHKRFFKPDDTFLLDAPIDISINNLPIKNDSIYNVFNSQVNQKDTIFTSTDKLSDSSKTNEQYQKEYSTIDATLDF